MTKRIRKKYRIKKKKSFFENNLIFGLLVFLLSLAGGTYLLFFHPFFQVNSIEIKNSASFDNQKLTNYFEQIIAKNIFLFSSKSIIPLSADKIRSAVLSQSSVIKNIKIEKIFPSQLQIKIIERTPVASLCKQKTKNNCYYIDKEGIVLQRAIIKENKVVLIKEGDYSTGEKIIGPEIIEKVFYLKSKLAQKKLTTDYFDISRKNSTEVVLKENWFILFSDDNYKKELQNLKHILEKFSAEEIKEINYIDLRFGDRIYYK